MVCRWGENKSQRVLWLSHTPCALIAGMSLQSQVPSSGGTTASLFAPAKFQ
jgi:hypothetical protein